MYLPTEMNDYFKLSSTTARGKGAIEKHQKHACAVHGHRCIQIYVPRAEGIYLCCINGRWRCRDSIKKAVKKSVLFDIRNGRDPKTLGGFELVRCFQRNRDLYCCNNRHTPGAATCRSKCFRLPPHVVVYILYAFIIRTHTHTSAYTQNGYTFIIIIELHTLWRMRIV